jgi:ATP-binding cassette subfamily F protein 1
MDYVNFSYDRFTYTRETISINSFDMSVSNKQLFKDATLSMASKSIYGLIGKNGSGKSTLLRKLCEIKDTIKTSQYNINTLYVEQEINLDSRTPTNFILDSNYKQKKWEKDMENINQILESDDVSDIDYESLESRYQHLGQLLSMWNPEQEEIKVRKILLGLGFSDSDLEKESQYFSGGWQMRISLARALYLEPELLLLDEPTNHLDLEAIIWLSEYLCNWKNTVIVVSHNIGFLNEVCDYILNIEDKKLIQYKGNYSTFKNTQEARLKEAETLWLNYEKKLKELKKNAEKNKLQEFITKNEVPKPQKVQQFYINFQAPYKLNSNAISLNKVSFGYDNIILDEVSLGFNMDSRIVLVGPNGSGKSTIIKLMMGEIKPLSGEVIRNSAFRIGYYNQHFENHLPINQTPVEYLTSILPNNLVKDNKEQTVRNYLGQLKLEPSAHHKLISELSGGQKARIAIIKLIFLQPHCIILDEPTNHLDIDTVNALIEGLVNYEGGIMVITHEPELIERLDGKIWMMDPEIKNINRKIENYEEYCKYILQNL